MNPTKLEIEIAPMWSVLSDVKLQIEIAMQGYSKKEIESSIIVTSELIENAIKYGAVNLNISRIEINFEIEQEYLTIKVKNGVNLDEELDLFMNMMFKIRSTINTKELYIDRLKEILEDPTQPSHLGLYRIVSEAEFELECEFDENVLLMIAKKKLKGI